jgi:hypothetical protein
MFPREIQDRALRTRWQMGASHTFDELMNRPSRPPVSFCTGGRRLSPAARAEMVQLDLTAMQDLDARRFAYPARQRLQVAHRPRVHQLDPSHRARYPMRHASQLTTVGGQRY